MKKGSTSSTIQVENPIEQMRRLAEARRREEGSKELAEEEKALPTGPEGKEELPTPAQSGSTTPPAVEESSVSVAEEESGAVVATTPGLNIDFNIPEGLGITREAFVAALEYGAQTGQAFNIGHAGPNAEAYNLLREQLGQVEVFRRIREEAAASAQQAEELLKKCEKDRQAASLSSRNLLIIVSGGAILGTAFLIGVFFGTSSQNLIPRTNSLTISLKGEEFLNFKWSK